ncbi:hypothetical protein [Priestia sp. YIM B13489]|uniref:hypothetical protein n=1 Tax=Priestia sp. YIM B13489 TaxID=3366313 RepID=UPI00366B9F87
MRSNPKNFSVKIIKGHAYIYSWSYRRTSYRTHAALQRYCWKYRGRYGTRKVRDFMKRLDVRERVHLKEEVQRKLKTHKVIQQQVEGLLDTEPFKSRHTSINAIKNRITRENELRKFYSTLNSLIRERNETNK